MSFAAMPLSSSELCRLLLSFPLQPREVIFSDRKVHFKMNSHSREQVTDSKGHSSCNRSEAARLTKWKTVGGAHTVWPAEACQTRSSCSAVSIVSAGHSTDII